MSTGELPVIQYSAKRVSVGLSHSCSWQALMEPVFFFFRYGNDEYNHQGTPVLDK